MTKIIVEISNNGVTHRGEVEAPGNEHDRSRVAFSYARRLAYKHFPNECSIQVNRIAGSCDWWLADEASE